MATERERRLAENEALFRLANERMAEWEEHHADEPKELYFCECANTDCREKVSLSRADYERVRAHSRQFVVRPGHELPDVESVVEVNGDWSIIAKEEDVADTVEALDPRNRR